MIIRNGKLFLKDCKFHPGTVAVQGERIASVSVPGEMPEVDIPESTGDGQDGDSVLLDAGGCLVLPGFVDIHLHGCMGRDFCDGVPEAVAEIAEREALWGITSLCGTTMTVPEEKLLRAAAALKEYEEKWKRCNTCRQERGSHILGLHMEGPFIAREKKGAQKEEDIRLPDTLLIHRMQEASGNRVKILTFAPELPGAEQLIRELKAGPVLSIGHTNADYAMAVGAMRQGVHHVTHLYNAMGAYRHRAPGVVGAAADVPEAEVELIADGLHIHPAVIRNTYRMFGGHRVILISDSMRAAGLSDGEYELGGQTVAVHGKKALLEDGTLAGSVTNLFDCVRYCIREAGIPAEDAIRSATLNPAAAVGAEAEIGSIEEGKYADLLLVDEKEFALKQVVLRGRLLHQVSISK